MVNPGSVLTVQTYMPFMFIFLTGIIRRFNGIIFPGDGGTLHAVVSLQMMNPGSPFLSPAMKDAEERICGGGVHEAHRKVTDSILLALRDNHTNDFQSMILQAANIRKFLG